MNQLTLDLARDRGTAAGQACVDKADRTAPGWSERAYDAIRRFAAGQAGAFTIDSLGGAFIRAIEGDPHCVIGLSLHLMGLQHLQPAAQARIHQVVTMARALAQHQIHRKRFDKRTASL